MTKIGRQDFERKLKDALRKTTPKEFRSLTRDSTHLIMLAYRLSKYGHRNQKRDNGERYFEHPKRVALILMDELNICNPEMIIAALLHDIKEDSFMLTWRDIEFIFGPKIRKMIRTLTKDKSLIKPQRDEKYCKTLQKASRAVKIIKLADRLDNLRSFGNWPPERRKEYIKETIMIFLPMAQKINDCLFQDLKKFCEGGEKWQRL